MKIFVKVKPNSEKEKVERVSETHFVVSVKEPPKDGKANEAVIRVLAKFFGISKLRFKVTFGRNSREKLINIG